MPTQHTLPATRFAPNLPPLLPQEACALDAVLTVVDARHVTPHLDEVKPDGVVNEAGEAGSGVNA